MRFGAVLAGEDLAPRHADQLDGHALGAAVTVRTLGPVGKSDKRIVDGGLGK